MLRVFGTPLVPIAAHAANDVAIWTSYVGDKPCGQDAATLAGLLLSVIVVLAVAVLHTLVFPPAPPIPVWARATSSVASTGCRFHNSGCETVRVSPKFRVHRASFTTGVVKQIHSP